MKRIIIIALVAAMAFATTACGSNSNIENTTGMVSQEITEQPTTVEITDTSIGTSNNNKNKIQNNIKVETKIAQDGLMCAFITNNNNVVIDELELQVNFYDSNNNIIDLDEDGHDMILPGATVASRIDTPNNYDHFDTKVSIELGVHEDYENHSKDIDLSYNLGEDCVIIQITNNSDVEIDEIEYIVLLYKDNELVTVESPDDVYDVAVGDTITEKVYTPETHDRAEVYLNQAHTFD